MQLSQHGAVVSMPEQRSTRKTFTESTFDAFNALGLRHDANSMRLPNDDRRLQASAQDEHVVIVDSNRQPPNTEASTPASITPPSLASPAPTPPTGQNIAGETLISLSTASDLDVTSALPSNRSQTPHVKNAVSASAHGSSNIESIIVEAGHGVNEVTESGNPNFAHIEQMPLSVDPRGQGIQATRQRYHQYNALNLHQPPYGPGNQQFKDTGNPANEGTTIQPNQATHHLASGIHGNVGYLRPASAQRKAVSKPDSRPINMATNITSNDRSHGVHDATLSNSKPNSRHQSSTRWDFSRFKQRPGTMKGRFDNYQEQRLDLQSINVKIEDIPTTTTTRDLYLCFCHQGTITSVKFYDNTRGEREGTATIKFEPPPLTAFWNTGRCEINVANVGLVQARMRIDFSKQKEINWSPASGVKKYEEPMVMEADSLDFGMMYSPTSMLIGCTVSPIPGDNIQFQVNLQHREITVEFMLDIRDPRTADTNTKTVHIGNHDREEKFRFQIPFSTLQTINQVAMTEKKLVFLFSLETPPKYFKKLDPRETHEDDAKYWSDNDAWYRQTDVYYGYKGPKKLPLSLQKPIRPVIDLGRWTTYRLVFDKSKISGQMYKHIFEVLQDHNIEVKACDELKLLEYFKPTIWDFFTESPVVKLNPENKLIELAGDALPELTFNVRYQLEVCISNGYLNEHNITHVFMKRLASLGGEKAQDLLEYVANHGKRVFDVMSLFDLNVTEGSARRAKIPAYCAWIRSATVTPTMVYYQTPVPETTNRVIRKYSLYADRFLRVRFTEEKTEGAIHGTHKNAMNDVFTRVKRILTNGIIVGGRKYEFLACGNSQFREHGAYFFAPLANIPTERIHNWMGMFRDIKTVPLYLARLGQCFSTTRAISSWKPEIRDLEDIERNGYNFTDGVGKISPFAAHRAASALDILQTTGEAPSAFQVRIGGCKGILAVWKDLPKEVDIYVRRSQYKFPARDEILEIIRWSQFSSANLNRQLIIILDALGVHEGVFSRKLQEQLSDLARAMIDEKMALGMLQKDTDHNQMTLVVAGMILDGFQKAEEPFLTSLLQLWRAWSIKFLKEKARITIRNGALLFGCVDETAILRGHYDRTPLPPNDAPLDEKAAAIPEVFVQVTRNADSKPDIILGPMLLARNPSLHPGDVRVVCGVDIPELHHLKNVVVMPQTGDRDIASMCCGGDLDGDDFIVIWDRDLLPLEWNHDPMDYSRPKVEHHGREIGIDDLTTFFVTYMKNDSVGRIANTHLALADYLDEGVKDRKCLELANLHSMAVDYPKTGQPARMSRDLDFHKRPHYMRKPNQRNQRKEDTWISEKVLGQLYEQVERVDFTPSLSNDFDDRILSAYELGENLVSSAGEVKQEYDAFMRRIMAQHEITTEFEVWSTFVLEHSATTNDFKFHEQIGQISSALKDHFRNICYERAGGKTFDLIGPFAAAMYKVTADETANATRECYETKTVGGREKPSRRMTADEMPLMSFPWLFHKELGKIATGRNVNI